MRDFPGRAGLETSLRITLPGDPADFQRLTTALDVVLAPEAIVFDLDGVLADVRASQRAAMVETAATYGVTVTMSDIEAALRTGDAANDWIVTQRLITARGMQADLETVTARFQALYLGTPDSAGLRDHERLIVPRAVLARLADRLPLAVVTGRPRDEARWFLERVEIGAQEGGLTAQPLGYDGFRVRLARKRENPNVPLDVCDFIRLRIVTRLFAEPWRCRDHERDSEQDQLGHKHSNETADRGDESWCGDALRHCKQRLRTHCSGQRCFPSGGCQNCTEQPAGCTGCGKCTGTSFPTGSAKDEVQQRGAGQAHRSFSQAQCSFTCDAS